MTRERTNMNTANTTARVRVNWLALAAILATAAMWYGILWMAMAAF